MGKILELYKEVGETPLECILRFKRDNREFAKVKMTYLGRLDPMAEGLLLVLAGDTRNKKEYLSWDKTYEFEVLWDIESDTYDILGISSPSNGAIAIDRIPALLKKIKGKKTQVYPPFSSKRFGGDFLSARESKVEEMDAPERSIAIFSIDHIHTRLASGKEILEDVARRVGLVHGDFRQKEVIRSWQMALSSRENDKFHISKFRADVSSGTYIRSLAHEMGGLAWSIKRTRVGEYTI